MLAAPASYGGLFIGVVIVLAAAAAGVIVIARLRRGAAGDAPPGAGGGFTVGDLRRLRDSGQMSDEEFDRARAKIVDAHRRRQEREAQELAARSRAAGVTPREVREERDAAGQPAVKDVDPLR